MKIILKDTFNNRVISTHRSVAAAVAGIGQGKLHFLAVYQQAAAAMGDFMDFSALIEDQRGAGFQSVAFGGGRIDVDLFFGIGCDEDTFHRRLHWERMGVVAATGGASAAASMAIAASSSASDNVVSGS